MKKQYFLLSAIVVLTSCCQEAEFGQVEQNLAPAITTINASTRAETRAAVSSADNTKVLWQEGDQISVLGTNASSTDKNLPYTLGSGYGSTDGVFANATSDITSVSAIMYPYQAGATCSAGALTCTIPSEQTAATGSFDPTAAIMYALGNSVDADLVFAVNFLKVTVSAADKVHSITVRSSTKLTGSVSITSGGVATTDASKGYVTLSAAGTGALDAGSYYIAIAKTASIEKPSFIYKYTDGTLAEKTGSAALSFTEGKNVKPVSVNFSTGTVHRAVQLWDNGPYFATCNVGATNPEDYGYYFAWGATTGCDNTTGECTEHTFDWAYAPFNGGNSAYSRPAWEAAKSTAVDDNNVLWPANDAATTNWGGSWRMPTYSEQTKLMNECYWQWVTSYNSNSVNGYVVYKKNSSGTYSVASDAHIFLPAAGYRYVSNLNNDVSSLNKNGSCGYYWSSSLYTSEMPYLAWVVYFSSSSVYANDNYHRRLYGYSVRPVCVPFE